MKNLYFTLNRCLALVDHEPGKDLGYYYRKAKSKGIPQTQAWTYKALYMKLYHDGMIYEKDTGSWYTVKEGSQ